MAADYRLPPPPWPRPCTQQRRGGLAAPRARGKGLKYAGTQGRKMVNLRNFVIMKEGLPGASQGNPSSEGRGGARDLNPDREGEPEAENPEGRAGMLG